MSSYRVKDEDSRVVSLPINIKPAEGYKDLYAHGAMGGFLGNYHFRIDFYQDIMPFIEYRQVEGGVDRKDIEKGLDRKIVASIYLPIPSMKELAAWLTNNIAQYESQFGEVKLLTGNVEAVDLDETKRER
ncbi:MAG TPA: DUF3467 domain-containing protein [Blastocatellia bacterium]